MICDCWIGEEMEWSKSGLFYGTIPGKPWKLYNSWLLSQDVNLKPLKYKERVLTTQLQNFLNKAMPTYILAEANLEIIHVHVKKRP